MIQILNGLKKPFQYFKWHDKSTACYDILDFKTFVKSLQGKCLVIERHMMQIQGILLQDLKFN